MLMSMTAATYFFCAIVLWLGGWLSNERKYHSTKLQKYLSVADMITCIIIIMMVLFDGMRGEVNQHWYTILDWLCYIPYAMFYLESIVLRQQRPDWKSWVHTFGPLAISLPIVLIWGGSYQILKILALGTMLIYILLLYTYSLYKLRRWDCQMCEEFSDISHKQTAWFRRLTLPFILLFLVWIPWFFFPEQAWIPIVFYLSSATLAVAMSSHALAHEEFDFDVTIADDDVSAVLPASAVHPAWIGKLDKAMQEEHLYRQTDLTLSKLAEEIGVNRTYLSKYINLSESGSFYNYIASWRIEEAKTLLENTEKALSEIAKLCGFASQASFSHTFKNKVGRTPTEYRNNYSREKTK